MLLSNLLIMDEKIPVTDALLYALIGFAFVFIGIGILIGVLYLMGFIMQKTDGKINIKIPNPFRRKKKAEEQAEKKEETPVVPATPKAEPAAEEKEIPAEVKAAIVAAIMAYYTVEKPKCEFVIKKIKRI